MKHWKWFLLIFELALFAVILVLPQVDLPDFTFHGGTAPITAKSRTSLRPAVSQSVTSVTGWLRAQVLGFRSESVFEKASPVGSEGQLSLFCVLIC